MAAAIACSAGAQEPVRIATPADDAQVVKLSPAFTRRTTPADRNVTVLRSEKVADGIESRVVKDRNGRVYRQTVCDGIASPAPQRLARLPFKVTENCSFSEDFESWIGNDDWTDWIPEGWTEINTDGSRCTEEMLANYYNNSWHVGWTGDGYWTAATTDGVKECFIHFTWDCWDQSTDPATLKFPMRPQDEWLITPPFNVKTGHKLMFLLEMAPGDLFHYDYATRSLDKNTIDCDMEVLVSADNGQNWESAWKATDHVKGNMADEDIIATITKLEYYQIIVSMEKYFGKDVQIAFRYTNRSTHTDDEYISVGNSMAIDAVAVDGVPAQATYTLPYGTLMGGFTEGLWVSHNSLAFMPPYTTTYWNAVCNDFTDAIEWKYYNAESGDLTDTSTDQTVTVSYPRSGGQAYAYPELTASNEFTSNTYSFDMNDEKRGGIIYDGRLPLLQDEQMLAGTYDYIHKSLRVPAFQDGNPVFGKAEEGAWGPGVKQVAFGNIFPVTARSFEIEKVVLTLGEYDADADAEFTMDIHTLDPWSTPSAEPVYTKTIKGSDIKKVENLYQAAFPITDAEGNPSTFTIDYDPIVIFISGYDSDKVRKFTGCDQQFANDEFEEYDYTCFLFDIEDPEQEGVVNRQVMKGCKALKNYYNSVYLSLDGHYNYLGSPKKEVTIYRDSENVQIPMESDKTPDTWTVQFDEDKTRHPLTGTVTFDWLTVAAAAGNNDTHTVTFTAATPAQNRSMLLTFRSKGASFKVTVNQSESSGISFTTVSDNITVKADRNAVTVNGAQPGQPVSIFTVNGQNVARFAADSEGNATLRHTLPAGVYIIRVGNRTFKAMI